jgi:hypothetical protein
MNTISNIIHDQLAVAAGTHLLLTGKGCVVVRVLIDGCQPRLTLDEPPPPTASALLARAALRIERTADGARRELVTTVFGGCLVEWSPRAHLPPCIGAQIRDEVANTFTRETGPG